MSTPNLSLHTIASTGMAMNVNAKHVLAYHCISRNGNEYQSNHCMSFHIILLLGGNGNKDKNLAFAQFHCTFISCISLYRART